MIPEDYSYSQNLEQAAQREAEAREIMDAARLDWFRAKRALSAERRLGMSPSEAAISDIGRRRHRVFARHLVERLTEGANLGTSLQAATEAVFTKLRTPKAIASKAREMGNRPEIAAVISAVFSSVDLRLDEVVRHHIELIKSPNPRVSLRALSEYCRLVLPQAG